MLAIGLDIGSSFVKGVLLDALTGKVVAQASSPDSEMPIHAPRPGWAEQDPRMWWECAQAVMRELALAAKEEKGEIRAIGIGYQMHGLVLLDKEGQPVRPSVIWCDSRAGEIGRELATELTRNLGPEEITRGLLNEPGNFTVSKLAWVLRHEPDLARRIRWVMLPGDYIAWRLTGKAATSVCGLSEGMLWDFRAHAPHWGALQAAGGRREWIPPVVDNPGDQGEVAREVAEALGFPQGVQVRLRAGDQPMNGFALGAGGRAKGRAGGGETGRCWAASAGTSGVLYRVDDRMEADRSGVSNRFAHIGHSPDTPAIGTLFCLNGAGRAYAWLRSTWFPGAGYGALNELAASAPAGCDGVRFHPFGNGAERMFGNRVLGAGWRGLDFNRHGQAHMVRSVLEGIAFAFAAGMERLDRDLAPLPGIRAPHAGLFRSELFTVSLSSLTGLPVEIVRADGAWGAALGAAGAESVAEDAAESGSPAESYGPGARIAPDPALAEPLREAFETWKRHLPPDANPIAEHPADDPIPDRAHPPHGGADPPSRQT